MFGGDMLNQIREELRQRVADLDAVAGARRQAAVMSLYQLLHASASNDTERADLESEIRPLVARLARELAGTPARTDVVLPSDLEAVLAAWDAGVHEIREGLRQLRSRVERLEQARPPEP